jgi:dTDP-4-amino-4,6-dideoxygalactose transaminase
MHLQSRGIATGVHYAPIHLYNCYGNQPHLPQAEEVFPRIVSLPMYPDMTDADIRQVIDSIIDYYTKVGFIGSHKAKAELPQEEPDKQKRSAA